MLVEEKTTKLIDSYSRFMHKLRVQLTDACNFRCFYCMPENAKFKPKNELLKPDEIYTICSELVKYGVDEIRITGGEPTIRPEFKEIIESLGTLNLQKFCITSNGFNLFKHLNFLKENNCNYINISIDSLDKNKFNNITKSKHFENVLKSIHKSKDLGLNTKINVVLMRGYNDNEVNDFIDFSAKYDIQVRFIELMKIGLAYEYNPNLFISAKEAIDKIKLNYDLKKVKVKKDSTSFDFKTSSGASIGFIASESQPFCNNCSRLRLTATGKLRACIMSEAGINFKDLKKDEYAKALEKVILLKPTYRINHITQNMNQIGG